MKFTLSWLKDHLDTEAGLGPITDALTMIGLEVEDVEDRAAELAPFTVGLVTSCEPHPNADKLKVCIVDTGTGTVQVVCGAPNAHAGMKGVFAPAGTFIPGTKMELKKGVIRGVESAGMLCSEREMGLSDEHTGIIELPADAPVGQPGQDHLLADVLVGDLRDELERPGVGPERRPGQVGERRLQRHRVVVLLGVGLAEREAADVVGHPVDHARADPAEPLVVAQRVQRAAGPELLAEVVCPPERRRHPVGRGVQAL